MGKGRKGRRERARRRRGRSDPAPSSAGNSRPSLLVWPLLAVLCAIALYVPALDHPLVYDDLRTIEGNPSIHPPFDLERILIYERFRPLVNLSYAADVAFRGDEPGSFHRTNLALHAVAVVLLFFVVRGAARDARDRFPEASSSIRPRHLAGVVTLIFAVHPLQTETVTYASARSEALCAVFLFAGLLAARAWMRRGRPAALAGALGLFVLASLSKEVGAMMPFLALAWDRLLGPEEGFRSRWWRVHLPWSVLVALAGSWRVWRYVVVEADYLPRPPLIHLLSELEVIWRYVGLMLWPAGQSIIQPAERARGLLDPEALLAGVGLAAVAAFAWRFRRRWPLASLGVAWWLLLLAPSSSVIPLNELIAEHRVYAAAAGLVLAVVSPLVRLLEARSVRLLAICGVAVVSLLAGTTHRRLQVWETPLSLWEDAARKAPRTWRAVFGYGDALRTSGDCEAAIPVLQRARELDPAHRATGTNLAICFAETGRPEEAHRIFAAMVEEDPTYVQGLNNLGRLATLRGQHEQAVAHFERSLELDPGNVVARLNLILIHERIVPNPAEALRRCRELRKIAPQVPGMDECIERNRRQLRELGIE